MGGGGGGRGLQNYFLTYGLTCYRFGDYRFRELPGIVDLPGQVPVFLLEMLNQGFFCVGGEARTKATNEQLTKGTQTFMVFGLAVGLKRHDLTEGLAAKAALEGWFLVVVFVEMDEVVVGRNLLKFARLQIAEFALERKFRILRRLDARGRCCVLRS